MMLMHILDNTVNFNTEFEDFKINNQQRERGRTQQVKINSHSNTGSYHNNVIPHVNNANHADTGSSTTVHADTHADSTPHSQSGHDGHNQASTHADSYYHVQTGSDGYYQASTHADDYVHAQSGSDGYNQASTHADSYSHNDTGTYGYSQASTHADSYTHAQSGSDGHSQAGTHADNGIGSLADGYHLNESGTSHVNQYSQHSNYTTAGYYAANTHADSYSHTNTGHDGSYTPSYHADDYVHAQSGSDGYSQASTHADSYDHANTGSDGHYQSGYHADYYDYSQSGHDGHYQAATHADTYVHSQTGVDTYEHSDSHVDNYSDHQDAASYTDHTNTHADTGFDHTNYIPSKPALFNGAEGEEITTASNVLKGVVRIGLNSYDQNADTSRPAGERGDTDPGSTIVYYDLMIRKKGTTSWTVLLNNTTVDNYELNTVPYAEGNYEIRAVARNATRSEKGVTVTYENEKIMDVLIRQNIPANVEVINHGEIINFTFSDKGRLNPSGTLFKKYTEGIYASNPSGQQNGILLRVRVQDGDPTQYQKGEVELLTSGNAVITKKQIKWLEGIGADKTVVQSGGGYKEGYIFINASELNNRGEEKVKFRVSVKEYADEACTKLENDKSIIDTVSTSGGAKLELFLDFKPPEVNISYSTGPGYSKNTNALIEIVENGSGLEKAEYQWIKEGESIDETKWVDLGGASSVPAPTSGMSGNYRIVVRAKDKSQNLTLQYGTYVGIDNVPPTIEDMAGDSTYRKSHSVVVKAVDQGSGLTKLEYMWSQSPTTPTTGTWTPISSGATVTKNDGNGDWYLHVRATDAMGTVSNKRSGVFRFDNVEPVVTFSKNGSNTYARTNATIVTVSDEASGIKSMRYAWATSETAPSNPEGWPTFTSGQNIPVPDNVSGDYYLHVKVIDNAGNDTITRTNVFKMDNTVPYVTVTGNVEAPHWEPKEVTLVATGKDDHSGVSGMRVLKKNNEGKWIPESDWKPVTTLSYTTQTNGEFFFEVRDNVGLTNTDSAGNPLDETEIIKVERINEPIKLNSFKISPIKSTLDYGGVNAYLLGRSDFHATFSAEIEDKDIQDVIKYKLEITGPKSLTINKSISGRTTVKHTHNEIVFLIDEDMKNWPDGIYTAKLTVTDNKPEFADISSESQELKFVILREKPPVPVINVSASTKKATIEFKEHPVLKGNLTSLLTKEYAIGDSSYLPYTGPIDLDKPEYKNGVTIYARYKDINGNYSIAIENYIPKGSNTPGGSDNPGGGTGTEIDSEVKVEEGRNTKTTYINIRRTEKGKLDVESIFDFLKD